MELLNFADANSIFILISLAAFIYVAWIRPLHGVYLISVALPIYLIRVTIGGAPSTLLELYILTLFIIWLLKEEKWRKINVAWWKRPNKSNPIPRQFRTPLALLIIAALVGMAISSNQPHAFGIFKAYFIEPMLLLIVLVYEARTMRAAETVVRLLGLTVIVIGIIAMWQHATGYGIANPLWAAEATRRATTFFGYPNAGSLFAAPIVALLLGLTHTKRKVALHAYDILVITMGTVAILAAQTAGAVAGLLAAVWIILARYKRTRAVAVAGLIIITALVLNTASFDARWHAIIDNIRDNRIGLDATSFEIRVNQWRETMRMLADRPLTGSGLAGYQMKLVPYHHNEFIEIYLYPHNIILNFWTETGLLGVVALVWLLTVIFKTIHTAITNPRTPASVREWAFSLLLAWVTLLVHGLVDVPYFKNDLSALWMMLTGLTALTYNWQRLRGYKIRHHIFPRNDT